MKTTPVSDLELNILYQCDNNYAPYTGVSLTSLLKRNTHFRKIKIFIFDDGISKKNKNKMIKTVSDFGREIVFIDVDGVVEYIKSCGMISYRGGYTTYLKLFIGSYFENEGIDVERLVYIDSDSLVLGDLSELVTMDMGDDILAMVYDSLTYKFKNKYIGASENSPYYNAGFVVFNMKQWQKENITEKIKQHLLNVRAAYVNHEQDILNVVLRNRIMKVSPRYNFQPVHYIYSPEQYFKVFKIKKYYSSNELTEAKNDIRIYHTYRFIGIFPWDKNDVHPANSLFDREISDSEWRGYRKKEKKLPLYVKIERLIYKHTPKMFFLKIFQLVNHTLYSYTNRKSYMDWKKQCRL